MFDAQPSEPVERARQGSAALATLYEKHHLTIFRYLFYRTGDVHTAEDLTADVFVRMMRSLASYQPREVPFTAWLFRIARNIVIDHYRKAGNLQSVALEDTLPAQGDTHGLVERRLDHQRISTALRSLADDQRDVIVLRFLTGMPIAQVAEILGKSEDAIKGLQRRALLNLRQVLTEEENPYVEPR